MGSATDTGEIEGRLLRILEEELHLEVPSVDTDLFASALLDSLSFVQLLVRIEQDLGRRIPIEELELEELSSVGRISRLLVRGGAVHPEPEIEVAPT